MTALTQPDWDRFLSTHPNAHLLQTSTWGQLKAAFSWRPAWLCRGDAGAQILFRRLPLGFTAAYIPKGPVGSNWVELFTEIDAFCRQQRAVFLKVEPDEVEPASTDLEKALGGFQANSPTVQPRRTIVISLEGGEEHWLARMKQKTRYNIRLAEKKGVSVRPSEDVGGFHRLMLVTGVRDGFGVHNLEYIQKAYDLFRQQNGCILLVAEYAGQPIGGIMVFKQGHRAWYFYGATSDEERNRMPAYLLQWEAMRWAAAQGCEEYDLWGIPDADENELEEHFSERSDGLWGVYRFKRGFGGRVERSVGAFDRVYNPLLYWLYRLWSTRRKGEM